MNVNFHLRNYTEKSSQTIFAFFYRENVRYRINTGLKVIPSNWSKSNQKMLSSCSSSNEFNKTLKLIEDKIVEYVDSLQLKNKRLYNDEIQNFINKLFNKSNYIKEDENEITDFIAYIDHHISTKGDKAKETLDALQQPRRNLIFAFGLCPDKKIKEYFSLGRKARKRGDLLIPNKIIEFDEIDSKFIERFKTYLLNATFKQGVEGHHYKKNYIAKQVKLLKQFINAAFQDGYIKNANYKTVKAEWEEADTVYTTWEEIEAIKNLELEKGSIEDKVRDLYVFNCYCGFRFSDLCRINKFSFFKEHEQLKVKIRQRKTDTVIKFPILSSAENILIKYDFTLPILSEGAFNSKLKNICFRAGLTQLETVRETRGGKAEISMIPKYKMVSSHTGRRSFATNFDDDGVPLKEIMAVTGHSTEKSLRIYIKKKAETKFTGFLSIGSMR